MQKYPLTIRIMHWVMAALVITLLSVGVWMVDLPKEDPNRAFIYGMHKSFGILALIFIALRIVKRLRSEVPAMPREITYFYAKVSAGMILILYICMMVQPISGFLMSDFNGRPVQFFGILMPNLVEKNVELGKLFFNMHHYIGFAMIVLVVLHVAGWFKHYVFEKVNLLRRIW